jgi:hypothetical protein
MCGLVSAAWAVEGPDEVIDVKSVRVEIQPSQKPNSSRLKNGDRRALYQNDGPGSSRDSSIDPDSLRTILAEEDKERAKVLFSKPKNLELVPGGHASHLVLPQKEVFQKKIDEAMKKATEETAIRQAKIQEGIGIRGIRADLGQEVERYLSLFINVDNELGLNLTSPDAAIRLHLDLPESQGLVVSGISADSSATRAGIQVNDILLSLDAEPLKDQGELVSKLKAKAEKPAELKLLRGGKPITIRVQPRLKVQLEPVDAEAPPFWIGVSVSEVDVLLSSQLSLPPGHGLIVNDVAKESPGEKGGVKVNDILMEIGGKPLRDPSTMRAAVQSAAEKPVEVKLLRAGKRLTVSVTPEARKANGGLFVGNGVEFSIERPVAQNFKVYSTATRPVQLPNLTLSKNPQQTVVYGDRGERVSQPLAGVRLEADGGRDERLKLNERLDDLSREIKELREAIREMAKPEKK